MYILYIRLLANYLLSPHQDFSHTLSHLSPSPPLYIGLLLQGQLISHYLPMIWSPLSLDAKRFIFSLTFKLFLCFIKTNLP